ncbi:META domain-containing protein [Alkalitalea saponilacus]|uniref:META domain-containing protein n=1 Tax=Alkalitalea saponilacus TaxID=889453 RepID=A0A1T5GPQ1_9BACT|nr:hypothetical protein [Alkalitalea saponilacus]ASB48231.1 hypothetical protein CDL62_03280 [Alkalitalea saponilacus]SKC10367.1 hypothetical protein SAMN03080601_01914 [Alkalitalea saponilacus]
MKTKTINKQTYIVGMGLILLLFLIMACNKNEINAQDDTVLLREISENPSYISLPLLETTWTLIGFANEKSNRIKLAVPNDDNCYTLIFGDNGSIKGHTSTNIAGGKYYLDNKSTINIISFGPETYINEIFDGKAFIDAVNNVFSYQITQKGLVLKYQKDKHMLFKPIE